MTCFKRGTFLSTGGSRLTGEIVAETMVVWMVKVEGMPVQVLNKNEWSAMPDLSSFDDIFGSFTGGRFG